MDRSYAPRLRPNDHWVHPGGRTALGWLLALVGGAGLAQEGPSVTPYRPTVSAPAALSAPGWVEIETGLQRSRAGGASQRDNLNYALKYAFSEDWGLRLQGEGWVHEQPGPGHRGLGDSSLVLKHRHSLDEDAALGLELSLKLPTARRGLGSGRRDAGLLGIYSLDFGEGRVWHTDVNLGLTQLGRLETKQGHWQRAWAVDLARQLGPDWTVAAELSGLGQRGTRSTHRGLLAASYALSPSVVIDFGSSRGLNRISGGWAVFAGLTFLAGRIDTPSP
ncbi:transporter [Piscinibacter sp. SJAQ100]|uniref:Transporter n=1 Tax=Aquariibacter albus TaxID=2759899 RepID=A0A839HF19_9BURK|nr:transporter [Aquariibacter albus]